MWSWSSLTSAILIALFVANYPVAANETDVQACVCAGLDTGVRLESGAVADCVSETNAIEVDRTSSWAEAIGQALHYGDELNRIATIYLFCAVGENNCIEQYNRLKHTRDRFSLPIELHLFYEDEVLSDCANARPIQSSQFDIEIDARESN